jgi:hypothetical protein
VFGITGSLWLNPQAGALGWCANIVCSKQTSVVFIVSFLKNIISVTVLGVVVRVMIQHMFNHYSHHNCQQLQK